MLIKILFYTHLYTFIIIFYLVTDRKIWLVPGNFNFIKVNVKHRQKVFFTTNKYLHLQLISNSSENVRKI